ncbi:MAG: energy-coupled thiamine transporter ThiT [Oscillospiraceae bacterium]|nr:energy-coupled thiamine transporter ThiT [Oscillospiraceae bacterium]
MNRHSNLRTLTEGAISVALAVALSFLKIDVGAQGGSLNFAMIPLIVFAVHRGGVGWGVLAGFVFGVLKQIFSGFDGITWVSMLLDYLAAYAVVGLAGLFHGKLGVRGYLFGALVGCVARFIVHYISGVTIYAEYAEATYLGVNTAGPWIYSAVYNGFYMVFNTVAAVVLSPAIGAALSRIKSKAVR